MAHQRSLPPTLVPPRGGIPPIYLKLKPPSSLIDTSLFLQDTSLMPHRPALTPIKHSPSHSPHSHTKNKPVKRKDPAQRVDSLKKLISLKGHAKLSRHFPNLARRNQYIVKKKPAPSESKFLSSDSQSVTIRTLMGSLGPPLSSWDKLSLPRSNKHSNIDVGKLPYAPQMATSSFDRPSEPPSQMEPWTSFYLTHSKPDISQGKSFQSRFSKTQRSKLHGLAKQGKLQRNSQCAPSPSKVAKSPQPRQLHRSLTKPSASLHSPIQTELPLRLFKKDVKKLEEDPAFQSAVNSIKKSEATTIMPPNFSSNPDPARRKIVTKGDELYRLFREHSQTRLPQKSSCSGSPVRKQGLKEGRFSKDQYFPEWLLEFKDFADYCERQSDISNPFRIARIPPEERTISQTRMLAGFLLDRLGKVLGVQIPQKEKEIFIKLTKYVQGREYSPERDLFTHVRDINLKLGIVCDGALSLVNVTPSITASSPSLGIADRRVSSRVSTRYNENTIKKFEKFKVVDFWKWNNQPTQGEGSGKLKLMNTNEHQKVKLLLITKADYHKIRQIDQDFIHYKLVASVAAFKGRSMQEVKRLCGETECIKVAKGCLLYDQGEVCKYFYLVREGKLKEEVAVELSSYHKHPLTTKVREVIKTITRFVHQLGYLTSGDYFGHQEMIRYVFESEKGVEGATQQKVQLLEWITKASSREKRVVALTECKILRINLTRLLNQYLGKAQIEGLGQSLRGLNIEKIKAEFIANAQEKQEKGRVLLDALHTNPTKETQRNSELQNKKYLKLKAWLRGDTRDSSPAKGSESRKVLRVCHEKSVIEDTSKYLQDHVLSGIEHSDINIAPFF